MDQYMQPRVKPLPGQRQYVLAQDFTYTFEDYTIKVPKGFIYNGASIPWFAWAILYTPFNPKVMGPALIHDWLFYSKEMNFSFTNRTFLDAMLSNGVPRWKANLMYKVVSLVSKGVWNSTPKSDRVVPSLAD